MSALALKIIACVFMLIDHIGYFWDILPLRIIGRLAFPIFAFMIYNGYCHTSNKAKYALRIFVFAIATQIPFNLFCYGDLFYNNGNVFFTLLFGLLCIWSVDVMRKHSVLRWICLLPTVAVCVLMHRGIIVADYGAAGVLVILAFYFCDKKGWVWKIITVLAFLCARYYDVILAFLEMLYFRLRGMDAPLPTVSSWAQLQIYSVLALPLIFAYNGKKGTIRGKTGGKVLQYGFYLFYPLHMLLLFIISYFI